MKRFRLCAAAIAVTLIWPAVAWAASVTITESKDEVSPITVTAVGVPLGAPGITNVMATAESITFNYDDNIIRAHPLEVDVVMLEADGSESDVLKDFQTPNESLQTISFFSDDGAGLPATCTPSLSCIVSSPVLETGGPDFLVNVEPAIFAISDVDVPEPGSIWLLGVGLIALAAIRHRNFASRLSHPAIEGLGAV
jgi:PEP-CTERM motif